MDNPAVGFNLLATSYDDAIQFYCEFLKLFRVARNVDLGNGQRFVYLLFQDKRFPFGMTLTAPTSDNERSLVGRQAGARFIKPSLSTARAQVE
jgi:catechol 2,3-dioxygenase-like lactoylglutathione lyase family enzyme